MPNKIKLPFGKGVCDLRPLVIPRRALLVGRCLATKSDGTACRGYAVKGQVFCRVHLQEGYALFTLAVISSEHGCRVTDR